MMALPFRSPGVTKPHQPAGQEPAAGVPVTGQGEGVTVGPGKVVTVSEALSCSRSDGLVEDLGAFSSNSPSSSREMDGFGVERRQQGAFSTFRRRMEHSKG